MVPVRLLFTNPEHPRNLVRVWASIWALPINYGLAPVTSRSLCQKRKKKRNHTALRLTNSVCIASSSSPPAEALPLPRRRWPALPTPPPSALLLPPLPQLQRFLTLGGGCRPCLRFPAEPGRRGSDGDGAWVVGNHGAQATVRARPHRHLLQQAWAPQLYLAVFLALRFTPPPPSLSDLDLLGQKLCLVRSWLLAST